MEPSIRSLFITLKRSFAGTRETHVRILESLGLRRRQQTVERVNTASIRGAIDKVKKSTIQLVPMPSVGSILGMRLPNLFNFPFPALPSSHHLPLFIFVYSGEAHGDCRDRFSILCTKSSRSRSESSKGAHSSETCPTLSIWTMNARCEYPFTSLQNELLLCLCAFTVLD